ncbi:MAG: hypothetical protein NTY99_00455, partial [DPANN group archaeon]|nr:hypothetical protein [DPANN group archaeon]
MPRKPKRSSALIKKQILSLLKTGPLNYGQLQRKINTDDKTIRRQCEELRLFGAIVIEQHKRSPKTGRPYTESRITKEG